MPGEPSTDRVWGRCRPPVAGGLRASVAGPPFGVTVNGGELEGSCDSSLAVGASWSTATPDPNLIGANNGGRGLSPTSDDGHLNFKRGATFAEIFKGLQDLELKYGDTGVFLRGQYGYDFERKDGNREHKATTDPGRQAGAQSYGVQRLGPLVSHDQSTAV
ncbi:DUF1302 family protein, partial [Pseudomonas syringae]